MCQPVFYAASENVFIICDLWKQSQSYTYYSVHTQFVKFYVLTSRLGTERHRGSV